ncbi:hypothetical protein SCA6_010800 [Theobroma cacao]
MAVQRLLLRNIPLKTLWPHKFLPLSSLPNQNHYHNFDVRTLQTPSNGAPDSFMVEKILFSLKQGNMNSLRNYRFRLNPLIVAEVLSHCRDDLQLGQRFVDFLVVNCSNFKHSSMSLSAMIHVLVKCRRLSDAQALILRMVRKSGVSRLEIVESLVSTRGNFGSNYSVFDLLIRTYVQARKLREGSEVFRILRRKGFCISINACNSLLGGLVKIGWVALAWDVYREVVRAGVEVNAYTLNIMVNALCKDSKISSVKSFLSEMEEKGVHADIVTYNTIINAYCHEGHVEEAFKLMNSMSDKGLKPGLFTYNAIVYGLCKRGNFEKAKEALDEMLHIGLSPDTATYNTLLVESCRKNNISEVEDIFSEMLHRGFVPDLISFSSLIGVFSRNGHLDQALMYFNNMKRAGLVPDNVIYTILIDGYCRNGIMSEALKMRNEMLEQGCSMDVVTYNAILNGLCREKMLTEADNLLHEMAERGMVKDTVKQISEFVTLELMFIIFREKREQGRVLICCSMYGLANAGRQMRETR